MVDPWLRPGSGRHRRSGDHAEHQGDRSDEDEAGVCALRQRKRQKYVSKACDQCQRRKIKCDNNSPCGPCDLNGRDCSKQSIDMRRRKTISRQITVSHESQSVLLETNDSQQDRQSATRELAARLDQMERQLNSVLSVVFHGQSRRTAIESEQDRGSIPSNNNTPAERPLVSSASKNLVQAQVPTFAGETSIRHTLEQIEGYLEQLEDTYAQTNPMTPCRPSTPVLTPSPTPSPYHVAERCFPDNIRKLFHTYAIEPERSQWDRHLRVFCHEVHMMYPFMHLPTLWTNYSEMWNKWITSPPEHGPRTRRDDQVTVAQLWVCLAIGKCTESPRIDSQEGRHSAGWSLYKAARDLLGDLLSIFEDCSSPILVLQTLSLIAVYLFRLGITGLAEKTLGLAISHAHHLGLHRLKVILSMSIFNGEMYRRLWWCLYVMDRRFAIETGRPFLIQDMNVDAPLPRNLDDDWLQNHEEGPNQVSGLDDAPDTSRVTPISYLNATITYSKVLGKVWEGLYAAQLSGIVPPYPLCEHLEQLLFRAQNEVQQEFTNFHKVPLKDQLASSPRWQVQQQALMRSRWLSLRLLIRRPVLQRTASNGATVPDNFENEVTCMQITRGIIEEFNQIPEENVAYTFPLFQYLTSAVIISLGLIIKQPNFKDLYGNLTLHAALSLKAYCRRTWVSGKLIRAVSRLNEIASLVLDNNGGPTQPLSRPSTCQQPSSIHSSVNVGTQASGTLGSEKGVPSINDHLGEFHSLQTSFPIVTRLRENTAGQHSDFSYSLIDHQRCALSNVRPDLQTEDLTNLVMTDFDFEETSSINHYLGDGQTRNEAVGQRDLMAFLPSVSLAGTAASTEAAADCNQSSIIQDPGRGIVLDDTQFEEGVTTEMGWLQALFCSHVNPEPSARPK